MVDPWTCRLREIRPMSDARTVVHTPEHYGLRPEAAEYPMMLVLSFVYPCNALCPHCPYTNSNIRKEYRDAPFMSEAIFKKIADESGPYHAYLRISGGGEPMLHPQGTELWSTRRRSAAGLGSSPTAPCSPRKIPERCSRPAST